MPRLISKSTRIALQGSPWRMVAPAPARWCNPLAWVGPTFSTRETVPGILSPSRSAYECVTSWEWRGQGRRRDSATAVDPPNPRGARLRDERIPAGEVGAEEMIERGPLPEGAERCGALHRLGHSLVEMT